mgnify:FL=1
MKITGRRPKIIASDLDGTIVADYGYISDRTKAAFAAAHNKGIHIYFATGRPIRWMKEIKENFAFGLGICGNGAMIYDFINEKILEQWLISIDHQFEIVKRLRQEIPTVSFAVEIDEHFHREKSYIPRWDTGQDDEGESTIELVMKKPTLKIMARCSSGELTSDEMLVHANKVLSDIATVTHSNAHESLLEISALGISKGSTLAKVSQRLGITAEDVVTFGDNPNDFSMLQWAGRSWTLADGHPDAPKYAKFVTEPHQDDGVAKIIEQLIELPA